MYKQRKNGDGKRSEDRSARSRNLDPKRIAVRSQSAELRKAAEAKRGTPSSEASSEQEVTGAVRELLPGRIEGKAHRFKAGDEDHRLWVELHDGEPLIMVASDPKAAAAQLFTFMTMLLNPKVKNSKTLTARIKYLIASGFQALKFVEKFVSETTQTLIESVEKRIKSKSDKDLLAARNEIGAHLMKIKPIHRLAEVFRQLFEIQFDLEQPGLVGRALTKEYGKRLENSFGLSEKGTMNSRLPKTIASGVNLLSTTETTVPEHPTTTTAPEHTTTTKTLSTSSSNWTPPSKEPKPTTTTTTTAPKTPSTTASSSKPPSKESETTTTSKKPQYKHHFGHSSGGDRGHLEWRERSLAPRYKKSYGSTIAMNAHILGEIYSERHPLNCAEYDPANQGADPKTISPLSNHTTGHFRDSIEICSNCRSVYGIGKTSSTSKTTDIIEKEKAKLHQGRRNRKAAKKRTVTSHTPAILEHLQTVLGSELGTQIYNHGMHSSRKKRFEKFMFKQRSNTNKGSLVQLLKNEGLHP